MRDKLDFLQAVDAEALSAELAVAAPTPGAAIGSEFLGAGFCSFIFRTADDWIVRVARTSDAAKRHAKECIVLPELARWLPVAIPEPRAILLRSEAARFGAVAYPALRGRLMSAQDAAGSAGEVLAADLSSALAALHRAPIDIFGPIPSPDAGHLGRLWRTVADELRRRLPVGEWAVIADWWSELLSGSLPNFPQKTLVHADMWRENLLVEDGRLAGVLDWEYLSVSDPAKDLAVLLGIGEDFFRCAVAHYRERAGRDDPTLEHRARLLGGVRDFYGMEFAIVRQDEEEWADSLASLRSGPILGGTAPNPGM